MDEQQITDRVEGGMREPGITTRPAAPAGMNPAARSGAAAPRRKWRWWMPAAILVLGAGLIVFIQYGPFPDDAAIRNLATQAAGALTVLLLGVWFVFFMGLLPWRVRLTVGGIALSCVVAFLALFEVDGATGDMWLHFRPRWWRPADYGLEKLSVTPIPTERDAALPVLGASTVGLLLSPLSPGPVLAAPALFLGTTRDATIGSHEFPQFLGPDRNAIVHGVFLDADWAAHPPRQVWRKKIGAGWGAFVVVGDLAITQEQRGDDELTVARDRNTGDPVWSHTNAVRFVDNTKMGGDGPRATPTMAGGRVYAHGGTGILDCLDAATGDLIWTHDTFQDSGEGNIQWGVSASPLVIEDLGLVVISLGSGGSGGSLAAYDMVGGQRKWVGGTDKASYASPMLAKLGGKRQIVVVNHATVTGHDPADGKVLWTYPWQAEAPAKASQPPLLTGDRLLLTAGYGAPGVLLHVKHDGDNWTTEEVWTTQHMRTKFTTPVVLDHYAYGLDDDALACIDLNDEGKQMWRARADAFKFGQVLLVENLLIVQSEGGDVALVEADPSGYHKLGVLHAFTSKTWNNPALAGNRLFLRNDREAACYELATVAPPGGK